MKRLSVVMVLVMSLLLITCGVALAKKAKAPADIPQQSLINPETGSYYLYLGTWMGEMVGFPERGVTGALQHQFGKYVCAKNRYGDFLCYWNVAPKYGKKTGLGEVEISIVRSRMFAKGFEYWPANWYWNKYSDEVLLLHGK